MYKKNKIRRKFEGGKGYNAFLQENIVRAKTRQLRVNSKHVHCDSAKFDIRKRAPVIPRQ